jgi:hypothetical protein
VTRTSNAEHPEYDAGATGIGKTHLAITRTPSYLELKSISL